MFRTLVTPYFIARIPIHIRTSLFSALFLKSTFSYHSHIIPRHHSTTSFHHSIILLPDIILTRLCTLFYHVAFFKAIVLCPHFQHYITWTLFLHHFPALFSRIIPGHYSTTPRTILPHHSSRISTSPHLHI